MELEGVKLWNLWAVAGVVAGFQVVALRWRIKRELRMEEHKETVWFPYVDWMLLISFIGLLIFVFILPTLTTISVECVARFLAVCMIPLGVYPVGLIGHYQLFSKRKGRIGRDQFPKEEKWVLGVGVLLTVIGAACAVLACGSWLVLSSLRCC